jgi:hypothetical protein
MGTGTRLGKRSSPPTRIVGSRENRAGHRTDYYRLDLGGDPLLGEASSRMFRASAEPGQPSKCRSSIRKRFGRRSLPTLLDDLAGLYVLKVVLEHRFAEAQHL